MAVLKSGDLGFEFIYDQFLHGSIYFLFYFLWKDKVMVKNSVLKRHHGIWSDLPPGAFLTNADSDFLIRLIRKVLAEDKADCWESLAEPDLIIGIYPDEFFPFVPPHYKLIRESKEGKARREAREILKKEKGKLRDDLYTFIALVDAYNFKKADAYYGQGLSLQLVVERHELEKFVDSLEAEYQEFIEKNRIADYHESCEFVFNTAPEFLREIAKKLRYRRQNNPKRDNISGKESARNYLRRFFNMDNDDFDYNDAMKLIDSYQNKIEKDAE